MKPTVFLPYLGVGFFLALQQLLPGLKGSLTEGVFVSIATTILGVWVWVCWLLAPGGKPLQIQKSLWLLYAWFFAYAAEGFGTTTGLLFGGHSYSEHFQPTLNQVPIAVPFGWVATTLLVGFGVHGLLSRRRLPFPNLVRSGLGAVAIASLDLVVESAAKTLGIWAWKGGQMPARHILATFVVGGLLLFLANRLQLFNLPPKHQQAMPHVFWAMVLYFAVVATNPYRMLPWSGQAL